MFFSLEANSSKMSFLTNLTCNLQICKDGTATHVAFGMGIIVNRDYGVGSLVAVTKTSALDDV